MLRVQKSMQHLRFSHLQWSSLVETLQKVTLDSLGADAIEIGCTIIIAPDRRQHCQEALPGDTSAWFRNFFCE